MTESSSIDTSFGSSVSPSVFKESTCVGTTPLDLKSDVQCRESYMNVLDPKLNQGPWNSREDRQVQMLVESNEYLESKPSGDKPQFTDYFGSPAY